MNRYILLLFIVILNTGLIEAQVKDDGIRYKVLVKGIINKTFVFGKWTKQSGTETHLKYLGEFTTKGGKTYKIMNSCWIWGLARRATSRILFFDKHNHYIGEYPVGAFFDLPERLIKGRLTFDNTDAPDCDAKLVTTIDLRNGIPKEIFIKCKGDMGDIYTFYND